MITYILCDVEGTTTDIRFVHDILFPYAQKNMVQFYSSNPIELKRSATNLNTDEEKVVQLLHKFIEQDVKDPELKRIQGLIWQQGYACGTLQGHVYPDVLPAFKRWSKEDLQIGIYSSGSVWAQKLIYGHSIEGDLTTYIQDHFDLAVGFKYEPSSYETISTRLGIASKKILFLSDVEAELNAARLSGMQTIRLFRDEIETTDHQWTVDFTKIP
jgi:enolase-phosphatase E1